MLNVDWKLLQKQKEWLTTIDAEEAQGLVNFIDAVQDYSIKLGHDPFFEYTDETNEQQLRRILDKTAIYVPPTEDEPFRINSIVDDVVYVTGEESFEDYTCDFDEFDLNGCFYTLTLLQTKSK